MRIENKFANSQNQDKSKFNSSNFFNLSELLNKMEEKEYYQTHVYDQERVLLLEFYRLHFYRLMTQTNFWIYNEKKFMTFGINYSWKNDSNSKNYIFYLFYHLNLGWQKKIQKETSKLNGRFIRDYIHYRCFGINHKIICNIEIHKFHQEYMIIW